MPRPHRPNAIKRLEGTYRRDRDTGEVPVPTLTETAAPNTLTDPEAVRFWNKLVRLLVPARVLSEADTEAMTHLCNLHARCMRLWTAGEAPKAAELTQLRLYFQEFGLTPASRSKPSQIGEDGNESPEEAFFTGPRAVND